MEIEAKNLYGWKAHELKSGQLCLGIIPLGGRIISLRFCDEEIFFYQKEHAGDSFDFSGFSKEELDIKKRDLGFRVWGGDKTWVAPQNAWSEAIPPLTLDAGHYQTKIESDGISLLSPVDPETGLQISRKISIHANNKVILKQGFHNLSKEVIQKGIWNVSQVLRDVFVYLPTRPEEIIAYPNEGDSLSLQNEIIQSQAKKWSRIRCNEAKHFKYGAKLEKGFVVTVKPLAVKNNFLLMKRLFSVDTEEKYAHNVSVEVYNSPNMNYAEVEIHAPLLSIQPGESVYHSQTWSFQKVQQNDIDQISLF